MRKVSKSVYLAISLLVASQLVACSMTVNHSSNSSTVAATAAATATPTPTPTPGSLFSGGSGTIGDPYLISNLTDIETLNTKITSDYNNFKDKYYKQTADINFANQVVAYLPIGPADNLPNMADINAIIGTMPTTKPFLGSYDGDSHKLKNINFGTSDATHVGFFRGLGATGIVKNVIFENVTYAFRGAVVGTVVPYSLGTIDHVTITGVNATPTNMAIWGGAVGIQIGGGITYVSTAGTFSGSTNVTAVTFDADVDDLAG